MHFVNTKRSNKVVIYFESSSICVSPGFDGLTGDSPAVRSAASRRSDRRAQGGQTGNVDRCGRRSQGGRTDRSTPVRPTAQAWSDRQDNFGQTDLRRI